MISKKGFKMFQEYHDIVVKLKNEDAKFARVYNKHNELHQKIEKAEKDGVDHIDPLEIEKMKKEKLKFKDEAYAMIVEYKNNN
jgi:uncharacterized protein YdcH (DUF465 family)